jgi:hypothetical protein
MSYISKKQNDLNELNPESIRLLQQFIKDANKHGLVLFIGSGINASILPKWGELLNKLLRKTIESISFEDRRIEGLFEPLHNWCRAHFDVYAQASIIKQILGPEKYRLEIQDVLYENQSNVEEKVREHCDPSKKEIDPAYKFLRAIAETCCLPQVKAVATFNFDPLLECAIDTLGKRKSRPYYGQNAEFEGGGLKESDIPVYHIHGRLSPPEALFRNPNESIVFSYDEYFDKNADPLSWETATPLHLLRNYCTLWLGVSLTDWYMMRLLISAQSGRREVRSYCIQSLQEVNEEFILKDVNKKDRQNFQRIAMRFQATLFDAVGMRLIIAGSKYEHIPETITEYIIPSLNKGESNHVKL